MLITHDYSDFNPEGMPLPPAGRFLQRIISEKFANKSPDKGGYAFLTLTFEIQEGEHKGQKYTMDYLTGHHSPMTSKIAKENLGRIYFAVTGQKPSATGLDTALLASAPFYATITIEEKPKTDGGEGMFKSIKLNAFEKAGVNGAAGAFVAPASATANPAAATAPWTS